MKRLIVGLVALILAGPATAAPASQAASNDPTALHCIKPGSAFARAACSDPEVSAAYRKMWDRYNRALAVTPTAWKSQVQTGQQSWMAYMAASCRPGDLNEGQAGPTRKSCWIGETADREKSLTSHIWKIGTRTFISLKRYSAKPTPKDELVEGLPRSDRCNIELVQIVAPANAAEQTWNAMIAQQLHKALAEGCGVTWVSVVVNAAGSDFIDATIGREDADVGANHPNLSLMELPWSLRLGRPVTATDIFADPERASAAMTRMYMQIIPKEMAKTGQEFSDENGYMEKEIARYATLSDQWLIGPRGVRVVGDNTRNELYTFGDYLSWADLKPYLREEIPIDLSTLKIGPFATRAIVKFPD